VLDEVCPRQQDKLHRTQAGPNAWDGPAGNVSISLNRQVRNFAELLVFG
jgi:hypothetical protein